MHGTGKFDKTYFVSRVVHVLKEGNYLTEFSTGLSPAQLDTFAPPPPQGPVVGLVKSYDDPDSLGRIQVFAPGLLPDSDALDWAPVASPFGKASMWVPDIGDQVMVCFLGNDLAAPIVVGSLHSKIDKTPVTKEQMKDGMRVLGAARGPSIQFQSGDHSGLELRGDATHGLAIGDVGSKGDAGIVLKAGELRVSAKAAGLEAVLGRQKFALDGTSALLQAVSLQLAADASLELKSGTTATIDAPGGIRLNNDALQVL